jgi:hypothetical protein
VYVPIQIGIRIFVLPRPTQTNSIPPSIERNLIEFAAENGDWRGACLEDEMYTCSVTKELIHPAHVETSSMILFLAQAQTSDDYL